jgi:uncharacterized protein (DUF58 family)
MAASPLDPLRRLARRPLDKWLFQLGGAEAGEVLLRQRRVFILPTRAGLAFGGMLVLMFIGAVNYNLNLGFALTFLVAACGLVDMHMTFRNLAHLALSGSRVAPVFAGEEAQFALNLANRFKRDRYALWIGFMAPNGARPYPEHAVDVPAMSTETVTLYVAAEARGWLAAPRVRLHTRFPLGLLRAWSYWTPDSRALVYPRPEADAPPLPLGAGGAGNPGPGGQEDFGGIRAYQAGDALRHLAWRQIARLDPAEGGQLVTKTFDGAVPTGLAIDYAALPAQLDVEAKLSRMTRWVLEAEQRALPYSFALGATVLPAAIGPAHQNQCLTALALYGLHERDGH